MLICDPKSTLIQDNKVVIALQCKINCKNATMIPIQGAILEPTTKHNVCSQPTHTKNNVNM